MTITRPCSAAELPAWEAIESWPAPLDVLTAWPVDRPLIMLHSGRAHARWARWSILSTPIATYQFGRDGRSRWVGRDDVREATAPPQAAGVKFTHDPLVDLDQILAATQLQIKTRTHAGTKARRNAATPSVPSSHRAFVPDSAAPLPFCGGWIGYFSYDLGRLIEPTAQHESGAVASTTWPLIELAYCPAAAIHDNRTGRWHAVGDRGLAFAVWGLQGQRQRFSHDFSLGQLRAELDSEQYIAMVKRAIEYIGAGDIFQANIAQRFSSPFEGSMRGLCCDAMRRNRPWYGAYIEMAQPSWDSSPSASAALLSLSPELFLHTAPETRKIVTRPIKGTRPASVDRQALIDSCKDAAELHMIIDLMRNDLGRVCEFGSVMVANARRIETHPTVHHGVGEVTGRLRENVTLSDLLRATFPGGSITGAPKIRAMQIIDELEPVRRGPYCGSIGYISNCGAISLSIAIRTMLMRGVRAAGRFDQLEGGGALHYSAGAGIVADSDPQAEYRETLDKTAVLRFHE